MALPMSTVIPAKRTHEDMSPAERISSTDKLLDKVLDRSSADNTAVLQRVDNTIPHHIKGDTGIAKRLRLGLPIHRRRRMNSQNGLVIPEPSASMSATEHRAEGKSPGERVAAIPELLDEIFAPLLVKQTFALQRVSKAFQSHIRGDTVTAKRLQLVARRSGKVNIDPQFFPAFSKNYDWLGPRVFQQSPRFRLFTISKMAQETVHYSWKDTLICQPPIQVMTVFEGESSGFASEYLQTLACGPGITLGSIYEMAKTMLLARGRAEVVYVYYRARNNRIEVEFWKRKAPADGANVATSESMSSFGFGCSDNPGEAQMSERVFLVSTRSHKSQ